MTGSDATVGCALAFIKEAEEIYKRVRLGKKRVLIDKNIPVLRKIPDDKEEALALLRKTLDKTAPGRWSHAQVAISAKEAKKLLEGVKPGRDAVPLFGERVFAPSWRLGDVHLHRLHGVYVAHRDEHFPYGSVRSLAKHVVDDMPRAVIRRLLADDKRPFVKTAAIDIITGHVGAGKSTRSRALADQYDLVAGTDLGQIKDGVFVQPKGAEKEKLRQAKLKQILAAHRQGKRVLVEGFPSGVMKFPEVLAEADRVQHVDTPFLTRYYRIAKRSRKRGTSVLRDYKDLLGTEIGSRRDLKKIQEVAKKFEKTSAALPDGFVLCPKKEKSVSEIRGTRRG